MQTTDVRALKKDPSQALRMARESGPVLILKDDEPDALLVHLEGSLAATEAGLRPALAASLYRDGCLSLGRAAEVSGLPLSDFIGHLDVSRPAGVAARMRAQGLRPVHFWVPDTRTAAFRTEARRQASATALSAQEPEDQAFIDAVSDRTET